MNPRAFPAAALAFVLATAVPPMVVRLADPGPARIMENLSLASSQETWLRMHAGERRAWLVPSLNGQPRIHKPPLLVWANLLAWADLAPATADLRRLVLRARLAGVGFALLALAATAWAGYTLGGPRLAGVGTLATGTSFLFLRQARCATYDLHLLGWLTLAVAAGLAAMAPRRPGASRARGPLLWLASGLALGAAAMTKGPLALVLGLGPLAAVAAFSPWRSGRAALGLLGAALAALALVAPWYGHVLATLPGSAARMFVEYRAERDQFQPPWYYLGLVALVFPWSVWLPAGLARPRDPESRGRFRGRPEFLWFAFVVLFLSIPMAKQQRYILPALPPAGLLAARALLARDGSAGGPAARAHAALLFALSPLVPLFLALQPRLLAAGRIARIEVPDVGPAACLLLAPLLLLLAERARRALRGGRAGAAACATALWMGVVATVGFYGYARAGHGDFAEAADAARIDRLVGDAPFRYLAAGRPVDVAPSKEFLLYTRRVVPALGPADARAWIREGRRFFLAVRVGPAGSPDPAPPGMVEVARFHDGERRGGRRLEWRLLRAGGDAPAPVTGRAVGRD